MDGFSQNNSARSSGDIYKRFFRDLLFRLDPETAHSLAHEFFPLLSILRRLDDYRPAAALSTSIAGKTISSPVGLAAGFDKNAQLLPYLHYPGFSFAEIGSITARASSGNPRPRLFRLPEDNAVINRMGLNGDGAETISARLAHRKASIPLAVNIAKTNNPEITGSKAVDDLLHSFSCVKNLELLYIALNVSCPNTHEDTSKEIGLLDSVLREIQKTNTKRTPLFLKLSPDSTDELLAEIMSISSSHGVSGFICGNTTLSRSGLKTNHTQIEAIGHGGLSGKPLKSQALALCRKVSNLKGKSQEIIACGGIANGEDAFEFLSAGARAIEIYTALVYEGPFAPMRIGKELEDILIARKTSLEELAD